MSNMFKALHSLLPQTKCSWKALTKYSNLTTSWLQVAASLELESLKVLNFAWVVTIFSRWN